MGLQLRSRRLREAFLLPCPIMQWDEEAPRAASENSPSACGRGTLEQGHLLEACRIRTRAGGFLALIHS